MGAPGGEGLTLLLVEGGGEGSEIEALVSRARRAVVLGHLGRGEACQKVCSIVLGTDQSDLADSARSLSKKVTISDTSGGVFHFGEFLCSTLKQHSPPAILYLGGGACPFLREEDLDQLASSLLKAREGFLSNNLFSSDLVGWTPASRALDLRLPEKDNALAYLLLQAGLPLVPIPGDPSFLCDLDTPTDVALFSFHPSCPEGVKEVASFFSSLQRRSRGIISLLAQEGKELFLWGRAGSWAFSFLNQKVRARIRLFSEERGMKAQEREKNQQVISLLGLLLEGKSPRDFFSLLSRICHGAILDTRVLMAHRRIPVTTSDRFYSDAGEYEKIKDPFWREFAYQAWQAPIPVLLGGHSLVLGGIWILVQTATGWYTPIEEQDYAFTG